MKRSDFPPIKVIAPPRPEWRLRHELRSFMRMMPAAFGIYICYRLMTPFLPSITAAQGLLGRLMFWWLGLSAPLLWGVIVVGTIANLVRPILVGERLQTHTVLAFLMLLR